MKNYCKYSKILIERGGLWAKLGTLDGILYHLLLYFMTEQ